MKTRKLACQGCGADIDPVPGEKYIDCAYCGTTNVLVSDTVQRPPQAAPPQQPPGGAYTPQMQIRVPSGPSATEVKKAGKIVALVVLSVVIAFVGIGATIFMRVFRGVSDAKRQHREAFQRADDARQEAHKRMDQAKRDLKKRLSRPKKPVIRGAAGGKKSKAGAFSIKSDRPLTADVDQDGIADMLVRGRDGVVAALDGTSGEVLWKKTISGQSRKIFLMGKTLLVAHGDHLTALAIKDGKQQWTTKLPNRADQLELRKSGLAIETGDDERLTLDPATGKTRPGKTARFKLLTADDGRKYMSNLGRSLRLRGRKRRVRLYYCRHGQILRGKTVTRRRGPFTTRTTTYGCRDKRALVWAQDKRGRKGFIIGLKKGRGKVWEHQLPGRARRFGGSQPKIGIHGDNAVVAHGGGHRSRTPITVALLSLTTGKSKWTHTLPAKSSVRGVVVTAKRVFIRLDSWIRILDVATGKPPVAGSISGDALPAP